MRRGSRARTSSNAPDERCAQAPGSDGLEPSVTLARRGAGLDLPRHRAGPRADAEEAGYFRDRLLRADLRGHSTQGSALIPYHDEMIASGQMRFGATLERVHDSPSVAVVDAHFGVARWVGTRCMAIAVEKAERTGIGCVTFRNSGDFAMASAYSLLALDHGMVGVAIEQRQAGRRTLGRTRPAVLHQPDQRRLSREGAFPARDRHGHQRVLDGRRDPDRQRRRQLPFVGIVDRDGRYGSDPAPIVLDVNERESKLDGALLPFGPKDSACC